MVGGFDREEFRRALLNEARTEMSNVSVLNNMNVVKTSVLVQWIFLHIFLLFAANQEKISLMEIEKVPCLSKMPCARRTASSFYVALRWRSKLWFYAFYGIHPSRTLFFYNEYTLTRMSSLRLAANAQIWISTYNSWCIRTRTRSNLASHDRTL